MGAESIFDGFYVDQLIQKNGRGETVLYPHGMLGRGYVVPAGTEIAVRNRVRMVMLVSLAIGIGFAGFATYLAASGTTDRAIGWMIIAGLGGLLIGSIAYLQSRLTVGLTPDCAPRPSPGQWMQDARLSRPAWANWARAVLGAIVLLLALASVIVGFAETNMPSVAGSAFLFVVGAFGTWDGVLGLRAAMSILRSVSGRASSSP